MKDMKSKVDNYHGRWSLRLSFKSILLLLN